MSSTSGTFTGTVSANTLTVGNIVITDDNISGANIGAFNQITGTLTTAAQPNITSLGTLTELSVTGNVDAAFFVGDGSGLTNVASAPSNRIENGTSNVIISSTNGITEVNVDGVTVLAISQASMIVNANATISGLLTSNDANLGNAVTANVFIGNLIGTANEALNSNTANTANTVIDGAQPNITSTGTLTELVVSGNINAANLQLSESSMVGNTLTFSGNTELRSEEGYVDIVVNANTASPQSWRFDVDSSLTVPTGGSIDGGNLVQATFIQGILTTSSQPNVTSLGTLSTLDVTGNLSAGNVSGTLLSGTLSTVDQPNVTSLGTLTLLNVNGDITAANITANTGVFTGNGSGLTSLTGANVTGTVGSATVADSATTADVATTAVTAGTVTTAAQPNITSTGTLTSLTVSGNVDAGNVDAGNLVQANFIQGVLTTNDQPNVTSLGTLTGLTVTGNLTAGNVDAGNLVQANFIQGDGSLLTNISIGAGSFIENGTSEVTVSENGNVTVTVAGNAVVLVTNTGINVTGHANVSGNITAENLEAILLTGTLTTADQPNVTSLGTLSNLFVSGESNLGPNSNVIITGGVADAFLKTDGTGNLIWDTGTLTPAQGADTQVIFNDGGVTYAGKSTLTFNKNTNILTVSNAIVSGNVFANSGTIQGSLLAGTLSTANQPNITSIGTLTSLNVNGSITAANITANTGVFTGNGSGLTSLTGANVTGAVATATTAVTAGTVTTAAQPNITSTGTLTSLIVSGNINASNVSGGNLVQATFIQGTLTTAAQPNITSVGTLTSSLNVNGSITAANITANTGVFTGNGSGLTSLTGANVTGVVANATFATTATTATTAGTVTTAAQPNITSTGTLTSLIVSGNINSGNLSAASGTITASVFSGNGSGLTNIPGANVTGTVATATTAGTVTTAAQPNITSTGTLTSLVVSGNANVGNIGATNFVGSGASLTSLNASNLASGTVPSARLSGAYSISVTSATTAGTVTTAAQPNITSTGTLTSLVVSGNISAANVNASGFHIRSTQVGISASGTTQGTATLLSKEINVVGTVSGTAGVRLPLSVAGMVITVTNTSANSLRVYPNTSRSINTLGTDVAFIQAPGATLQFIAPSTTQWFTTGATYA